jgi:hypothetical protein
MGIAGEIVNSRSAAADLTQSRSTRSARRRLDTKAGDSYCSLSPARPFRLALTLSEELPKKRRRTEAFVSSNWQPWCLSAGTFSNIDLWFLRRVPWASGTLIAKRGEHRVRNRRCLRWRGQKRADSISLKSAKCLSLDPASREPGRALVAPFPEPQGDPEQLSKWPQERAVLKLVL